MITFQDPVASCPSCYRAVVLKSSPSRVSKNKVLICSAHTVNVIARKQSAIYKMSLRVSFYWQRKQLRINMTMGEELEITIERQSGKRLTAQWRQNIYTVTKKARSHSRRSDRGSISQEFLVPLEPCIQRFRVQKAMPRIRRA